jgi:hypothetical protein
MYSDEVLQNFCVSAVQEAMVLLPIPIVGRGSEDCCARASSGVRSRAAAAMIASFMKFSFGM